MSNYFPSVEKIRYEGPSTENQLAYRFYDPGKVVLGKTMAEHLRIAVCYWHTFCNHGDDAFGVATRHLPWDDAPTPLAAAEKKLDAAVEFISKLGVEFFTFHDRDLAPEGKTFAESTNNLKHMVDKLAAQMAKHKLKLLWGPANCFSHSRYMAGSATSCNPEVFAYAAAQVKCAMEATHQLGGSGYVLWGGREGYDSLLNTNLSQELDQLGRFLTMVAEHKHKIGFKGQLLIEPKPCEPTKHQYDFDTSAVFAFLQKHKLDKEYHINIETNHATLAGHSFADEVGYACANNIFGSIDINRGDPQNGWDTDQFPSSVEELTYVVYQILQYGGFKQGGFNFDAKLRRQSNDLLDLFYAHIGGIDVLAKSLLIAADLLTSKKLQAVVDQRYHQWQGSLGQQILKGGHTLQSLGDYVQQNKIDPTVHSGRQELCENIINQHLWCHKN